jgi:hypothetical protein
MILFISPEELVEEYRNSWKLGWIKHPSIDYYTNAIHATFEGKDVIIFKFGDFGYALDNRFNTYDITAGPAGITIYIRSTKNS